MPAATPTSDIRFAQFAVKMKFVTPDQVRDSIIIQRRYIARDDQNFPSLARIMTAKNFLAKHQAVAVLKQVKSYEQAEALGANASDETNVLSVEQAGLVSEMGAGPDDNVPPAGRPAAAEPSKISGYRILEKIGSGGMGTVYKAHQESMDRIVALKVLPPEMTQNRRFVEQFLSEARAAGRLTHPNLIRVHDVGREGAVHFYSMEFVDGQSLAEILAEEEALPVSRGAHIMVQVAQALDHGHKHEIVHREIRPEAIMVSADDNTKLADLGLTKVGAKRFLMGDNAAYVSPEQASGGWTDIRTDLYSLGATFFHVFTGQMAFQGPTPKAIMRQHIANAVPDPLELEPDLPPELGDVLTKLMEKNPDERFQTPAELAEHLKSLHLYGRPRSSRRSAASGRQTSGSGRLRRSGRRSTRRSRRRRRR